MGHWGTVRAVLLGAGVAGVGLAFARGTPIALAADPSPQGDYRFEYVPTARAFYGGKIHKTTGQAWVVLDSAMTKTVDPTPVPTGTYDMKFLVAADGTYSLIRTEAQSGRTWWFREVDRKWNAFEEK